VEFLVAAYGNRHQSFVICEVEDFLSIAAPTSFASTVGRDLNFVFIRRITLSINLVPARLVRSVCDPSTVRREPSLHFAERCFHKRTRLAISLQRKNPQIPNLTNFIQDGFSVRRPVVGRTPFNQLLLFSGSADRLDDTRLIKF